MVPFCFRARAFTVGPTAIAIEVADFIVANITIAACALHAVSRVLSVCIKRTVELPKASRFNRGLTFRASTLECRLALELWALAGHVSIVAVG